MTRRRRARVFWLGAAAILVAAAPISPAAGPVATERPRSGELLVLRRKR